MSVDKEHNSLVDKTYMGVVEDPNDPKKLGRCRVRVFGIHGPDIPTEHLPWAYPKNKGAIFGQDGKAGAISIPKKDAVVVVRFDSGDISSPEFYEVQDLSDDIKEELQKENRYLGSHFILFDGDEDLKIWFNRESGMEIQLKGSRVNIGQDKKITIEHDESQSIIELEGGVIRMTANSKVEVDATSEVTITSNDVWVNGNATRVGPAAERGAAVIGTELADALEALAAAIDGKWPPSPGVSYSAIRAAKEKYLSKSVTISQ